MVNNIVAARPQRGLSKADILFEIKVEGGITRFMPVFTDYKTIGEIGPVRSGRDQFFRLILPWQALYIHEGQSVVMQQYGIDYDYGKLNNNDGANGYRDYGRVNWAGKSYNAGTLALEHTMYTNSDNIANYITSQNVDMNRTYNSTFFNFVDYRLSTTRDLSNSMDSAYSDKYGPVVSDGQYIEIVHSQSYKTRFIYDESHQPVQDAAELLRRSVARYRRRGCRQPGADLPQRHRALHRYPRLPRPRGQGPAVC